MMRSMFSGVSGLRAHQTRMDVIGNNISNVNTIGFKSGRVTFQEVFNQTLKGAGAPDITTGRGGTNPMQVGLGIGVGAVDTIVSRGSLQRTDNPTDLSIEGEGFFILNAGSNSTIHFTRAGNFGVDKLGNLVSGNGMNVQGWDDYELRDDGTYEFQTEQPVDAINLYTGATNKKIIPAQATSSTVFAGNLNAAYAVTTGGADPQFTVPITIYDTIGNNYKITVDFRKIAVATGTSTTWSWTIDSDTGFSTSGATGQVIFDNVGMLTGSGGTSTVSIVPDSTDAGIGSFDIDLNFEKLTMYAADSSAKPTQVDGYPTGNLVTFSIGSDGVITGIYTNGQQQPLGLIALASFENPSGLQKVGNNMFIPTTNSGDFKKGAKAGAEGVGTLNPGTLEMSNVDLSKEFTNMIVTQRGFQANTRIITTTDEMLQELVNLKR
jgi:flagellar hook protein FlgE